MYGLIYCLICALAGYLGARRSVGAGIAVAIVVGYAYGILRANLNDGFSHFIFDATLASVYLAIFSTPAAPGAQRRSKDARSWLLLLIGWPILLFAMPINNYLVQLVGLRHVILFLPAILLGSRARERDFNLIALTLAVANGAAMVFALLEYRYGLPEFYPKNAVTDMMYRSHDVHTSEGIFHRIPATFINSHAYGGAMLLSLPFLLNAAASRSSSIRMRFYMTLMCMVTVLAIFMAGPRLPIVQLGLCAVGMLLLPGLKTADRLRVALGVVLIGLFCGYYIASDERLQRFSTLTNQEMIEERVKGSVSYSLTETLLEHPMGVGLGGVVGSSLPYFLQNLGPVQVGAENEFARIATEQGVVGFLIWIAFLLRVLVRIPNPISERWKIGTHAMRAMIAVMFGTAFIGTGLLQSIPGALLMLLQVGALLRGKTVAAPQGAKSPADSEINPKHNGFAAAFAAAESQDSGINAHRSSMDFGWQP